MGRHKQSVTSIIIRLQNYNSGWLQHRTSPRMKTGMWLTAGMMHATAVVTLMTPGVTHNLIFSGIITTRQRSTAITTVSMLGTMRSKNRN